MRELPRRPGRDRRPGGGGLGGGGALVVVVLDGAVGAVAAERAAHQLGAGEAVGRAQHAGAQAGRSVGEGRGVGARVVRYVGGPVGVRVRRRRRVGQRAHGAQHVPEQRVELVGRAGGGAAPRRRDARVHGRAQRRGRPAAARAHYRRVDRPVERAECMGRLGALSRFTAGSGALGAAVVFTYAQKVTFSNKDVRAPLILRQCC